MNNKAFTLVELIGMVLILALVFLVSYPNFVSMSKKEDENKYDLMVKNLCLAGESYIYETEITIPNVNQTIEVLISDLISNGYVDSNFKDVETNDVICSDLENCTKKLTFTVQTDKSLECEYE